jgi:hypothetical protein
MRNPLDLLRHINKILLSVIILVALVRLFLPEIIKYQMNWYLDNKLKNYQGHINDVDVALYRGAFKLKDLRVWKRNREREDDFFVKIEEIDLSIAWRALLDRRVLGDLEVENAKIVFLDSDKEEKRQTGKGEDWRAALNRIVPIKLESFKIANSEVVFANNTLKVPALISLDQIDFRATNIKNTENKKEMLPSTVIASARLQKDAMVKAKARVNFISKTPALDLNVQVDKLDVTKLNDFLLAYGPVTLTSGNLSLYAEVATKGNQIKGYVKPFFENIDVISRAEKWDSPKRFFAEIGVALGNLILRNSKNKNVATKIDFEGPTQGPSIDTWSSLRISLQNAFIEALQKSLEHSISIKDVLNKK